MGWFWQHFFRGKRPPAAWGNKVTRWIEGVESANRFLRLVPTLHSMTWQIEGLREVSLVSVNEVHPDSPTGASDVVVHRGDVYGFGPDGGVTAADATIMLVPVVPGRQEFPSGMLVAVSIDSCEWTTDSGDRTEQVWMAYRKAQQEFPFEVYIGADGDAYVRSGTVFCAEGSVVVPEYGPVTIPASTVTAFRLDVEFPDDGSAPTATMTTGAYTDYWTHIHVLSDTPVHVQYPIGYVDTTSGVAQVKQHQWGHILAERGCNYNNDLQTYLVDENGDRVYLRCARDASGTGDSWRSVSLQVDHGRVVVVEVGTGCATCDIACDPCDSCDSCETCDGCDVDCACDATCDPACDSCEVCDVCDPCNVCDGTCDTCEPPCDICDVCNPGDTCCELCELCEPCEICEACDAACDGACDPGCDVADACALCDGVCDPGCEVCEACDAVCDTCDPCEACDIDCACEGVDCLCDVACDICDPCDPCETGECGPCDGACDLCDACEVCELCDVACDPCDGCDLDCGACENCEVCDPCDICDGCDPCETCEVTCEVCDIPCDGCDACDACDIMCEGLCEACEPCDACDGACNTACDICETCDFCEVCDGGCDACEVCDPVCEMCEACDPGMEAP